MFSAQIGGRPQPLQISQGATLRNQRVHAIQIDGNQEFKPHVPLGLNTKKIGLESEYSSSSASSLSSLEHIINLEKPNALPPLLPFMTYIDAQDTLEKSRELRYLDDRHLDNKLVKMMVIGDNSVKKESEEILEYRAIIRLRRTNPDAALMRYLKYINRVKKDYSVLKGPLKKGFSMRDYSQGSISEPFSLYGDSEGRVFVLTNLNAKHEFQGAESGSFKKVRLQWNLTDKKWSVFKKTNPKQLDTIEVKNKLRFMFEKEDNLSRICEEPSLLIENYKDGQPCIISEAMKGDCAQLVEDGKSRLSGKAYVDFALDISLQMAKEVKRIHDKGILHRDIKLSNFLYTWDDAGKLSIKLTDYGCAARLNPGENTFTEEKILGNIPAIPVECIGSEHQNSYSKEGDIYGQGKILYHLFCGDPIVSGHETRDPFSGLSFDREAYKKLIPGTPDSDASNANRVYQNFGKGLLGNLDIDSRKKTEISDLIAACLKNKKKDRISLDDLALRLTQLRDEIRQHSEAPQPSSLTSRLDTVFPVRYVRQSMSRFSASRRQVYPNSVG